jgi:hypothetical protein
MRSRARRLWEVTLVASPVHSLLTSAATHHQIIGIDKSVGEGVSAAEAQCHLAGLRRWCTARA